MKYLIRKSTIGVVSVSIAVSLIFGNNVLLANDSTITNEKTESTNTIGEKATDTQETNENEALRSNENNSGSENVATTLSKVESLETRASSMLRANASAVRTVTTYEQFHAAIVANENIILGASFSLNSSIVMGAYTGTIQGNGNTLTYAGSGSEMFVLDTGSNPTFENVVLDANSSARHFRVEGSAVLNYTGGQLKNGKMTSTNQSHGGSIYALSGTTLNISGTSFINNYVERVNDTDPMTQGGAIYILGGVANLTNVTAENNRITANNADVYQGGGGFVYAENSNVTSIGGNFTGNHTAFVSSNGNEGGAFFIRRGSFTSSSNTYNTGKTFNTGGAVRLEGANMTSTDDSFNIPALGDAYGISGGAIEVQDSTLNVTRGTFTNTSGAKVIHAGGFIEFVGNNTATINDSSFTGTKNTSISTFGGAISYAAGAQGKTTINNTRFENLKADQVGGSISIGGRKGGATSVELEINGSTFMNNKTIPGMTGVGGNIYSGPGSTVNLNGSTFDVDYDIGSHGGSTAAYGGHIYNEGTTTISGGSKLYGGPVYSAGGSIFNDGYLKLDEVTIEGKWRSDYVGSGWWNGTGAINNDSGEYSGRVIYAKQDVVITPKANIVSTDGMDIRVIDGQSAVVLTGALERPLTISISEKEKANAGYTTESVKRQVGYVVAKGGEGYNPTVEDAKKLYYGTIVNASSNPENTIAANDDHTSIGKWDYVLNPETNNVVLGQRATINYHVNASDAKYSDNTIEKSVTETVYKRGQNPSAFNEIPTRSNHTFEGWFTEANKDSVRDMTQATNLPRFKDELVFGNGAAITGILNPNVLNAYAGWLRSTSYNFTHVFVKEDSVTQNLPVDIANRVNGKDITGKLNGETVTPNDTIDKSEYNDTVNNGIWRFVGWTPSSIQVSGANGTFVGKWTFVPNKTYQVTHEFQAHASATKQLPQEVANRASNSVITNINNGTAGILPDATIDITNYTDVVNDGVWSFNNDWTPASITINGANGKFIGTWNFTANKYEVVHVFEKGDGVPATITDLPQEIKDRLPSNQTDKVTGDNVSPTNVTNTTYVDTVNDGTWTFVGWDRTTDTINKGNVTFTGKWNFVSNKYKVVHEFVSGTTGKELPKVVLDRLPVDQTGKVNEEVVKPSQFDDSSIAVNGGVWYFVSWNKVNDKINKADVKFIGKWEFLENPPVYEPNKPIGVLPPVTPPEQPVVRDKEVPKKELPKTGVAENSTLGLGILTLGLATLIANRRKQNK